MNPHVKWESPYQEKTAFILRRGSALRIVEKKSNDTLLWQAVHEGFAVLIRCKGMWIQVNP